MKVGIVGSGVVGFALGKTLTDIGNEVLFYDINSETIEKLRQDGFTATDNIKQVSRDSTIFFLCVPTPDKNKKIDLNCIKAASRSLARSLKTKKEYFLIVVKSTVVPGTTENVILPIFEKYSGKKAGKDFGLCFNPEFLQERRAYEDTSNPDRIVIGEFDERSGSLLERLYSSFKCPILRVNLVTSEMAKYANNCFYATKISFFNEIHMMCKKIGADSDTVRKVVQLDRFYSTHPWEHGHSFGGKCLPKDLNAVIGEFNHKKIHNPVLLKAVRKVNEQIDSRCPKPASA